MNNSTVTNKQVSECTIWNLLLIGCTISLSGFQILMWWIGSCFATIECLGFVLNIILAIAFLLPLISMIAFEKGAFLSSIFLFTIGIICTYICITTYCSWWLITITILMILIGIIIGEENEINPFILYESLAFYLLFNSCAWGTMKIMGHTPALPLEYWLGLVLTTLIVWYVPVIKKSAE